MNIDVDVVNRTNTTYYCNNDCTQNKSPIPSLDVNNKTDRKILNILNEFDLTIQYSYSQRYSKNRIIKLANVYNKTNLDDSNELNFNNKFNIDNENYENNITKNSLKYENIKKFIQSCEYIDEK